MSNVNRRQGQGGYNDYDDQEEEERYSAYDQYYGSDEEPEEEEPEPSVDSRVFDYSQTSTEVGNSRTRSFYSIDETSENTTQLSSWKQVADSDVDSLGVYNTKRYYTDSNTISITDNEKSLHSDITTSFRTELEVPIGDDANSQATVKSAGKSGATSATGEYEYDDEYDEYEYTEREGSGGGSEADDTEEYDEYDEYDENSQQKVVNTEDEVSSIPTNRTSAVESAVDEIEVEDLDDDDEEEYEEEYEEMTEGPTVLEGDADEVDYEYQEGEEGEGEYGEYGEEGEDEYGEEGDDDEDGEAGGVGGEGGDGEGGEDANEDGEEGGGSPLKRKKSKKVKAGEGEENDETVNVFKPKELKTFDPVKPKPDVVLGLPRDAAGECLFGAHVEFTTQTTTKVSSRINQLLTTLSKPRKKPLIDFYRDKRHGEAMHEIPKPGAPLSDVMEGNELRMDVRHSELLESLQMRVEETPRETAFTSWDEKGNMKSWTWLKLMVRCKGAAYDIVERLEIEPDSVVGVMIPNSEPFQFLVAYIGCLLARVRPLAIELPITNSRCGLTARFGTLIRLARIESIITTKVFAKVLNSRDEPLNNWPDVSWEFIKAKAAPSSFECPVYEEVKGMSPFEILEYRIHQGQIQAITRPAKMIMTTIDRLIVQYDITNEDIILVHNDYKRKSGLFFAIFLPIITGAQSIIFPFLVTKQKPWLWVNVAAKQGVTIVASTSRQLGLTDTRKIVAKAEQKKKPLPDISSIRATIVTDCATPWAVTYSIGLVMQLKQFDFEFHSLSFIIWSELAGLVLCKGVGGITSFSLSREYMSFGTVREQSAHEPRESGLLCYEFNGPGPGTKVALVRPVRQPYDTIEDMPDGSTNVDDGDLELIQTDAIGEIVISADGLDHQSISSLEQVGDKLFKCQLKLDHVNYFGRENGWTVPWVRTGVLGCLSRNGRICPVGQVDDRMTIMSRFHDSADVMITILKDTNFAFNTRIAVFSINCLQLQRLCIVAEEQPDSYDEKIYAWMNKVMSIVNQRHHESVFLIATVAPGSLPRHPDASIDLFEVRARLQRGTLHPSHVICCPHSAIHNLPRSKDRMLAMGPNSLMQGFLVSGAMPAQLVQTEINIEVKKRLTVKKLKIEEPEETNKKKSKKDKKKKKEEVEEIEVEPEENAEEEREKTPELTMAEQNAEYVHQMLINVATDEDKCDRILIQLNPTVPGGDFLKLSALQLYRRVLKMKEELDKFDIHPGDRVVICLRSVNLLTAMYTCMMKGAIPVPCRPPVGECALTATLVTKESKAKYVLASSSSSRLLRKHVRVQLIDTDAIMGSRRVGSAMSNTSYDFNEYSEDETPLLPIEPHLPVDGLDGVCYLDYSLTSNGVLYGRPVTFTEVRDACLKVRQHVTLLDDGARLLSVIEPFTGFGLLLSCFAPILNYHEVSVAEPGWAENHIFQLFEAFGRCQVVMIQSSLLGSIITHGADDLPVISLEKANIINVVYNSTVCGFELNCFREVLDTFALVPSKIITSVMSNFTLVLTLPTNPLQLVFDFTRVMYLDRRSLRSRRIQFTTKGAPFSTAVYNAGVLAPSTSVLIVDELTMGQASMNRLGLIWVENMTHVTEFETVIGADVNVDLEFGRLRSKIQTSGFKEKQFINTGLIGFIKSPDKADETPELFIVGRKDEEVLIRGMYFQPHDIESTVVRGHRNISSAACFSLNGLLVVCVELAGHEGLALDLLPLMTIKMLNELEIPLGVFIVLDPGTIIYSNAGEKQRSFLKDQFLEGSLDPIFVAYNI